MGEDYKLQILNVILQPTAFQTKNPLRMMIHPKGIFYGNILRLFQNSRSTSCSSHQGKPFRFISSRKGSGSNSSTL